MIEQVFEDRDRGGFGAMRFTTKEPAHPLALVFDESIALRTRMRSMLSQKGQRVCGSSVR